MRSASLTRNFIFNTIFTLINLAFPLLTFPYASRILGPSSIGLVTFVFSIVNYFVTCASLGIPNYGIREISKARDNPVAVSKIYSEVFAINFYATAACSIVYYCMIFALPVFQANRALYAVIGISILLNFLNVDWLYKGFENYVYITQRSIAFKLISLAMLFLLVRHPTDTVAYGLVQVIALNGFNIVNAFTARKYVRFSFKQLNLRRHFRPIILLFSSVLVINIYTNLDSTMLGILARQRDVGYYTAANKINGIVIGLVTSLGVVLFPRLSYYIKNGMQKEFRSLIAKSVRLVLFISIPACVGLYILAPQIICALSGPGFSPAITTMRIQLSIIIFVGLSNLMGIQILLPLGKERAFFISVLSGAVLDFLLNLFMIPLFQQNGAAISSTAAEFCVTFVQYLYTRKYMKGKLFNQSTFHYILASGLMCLSVLGIKLFEFGNVLTIFISILLGTAVYLAYQFFRRDAVLMLAFQMVFHRKSNASSH